MVAQYITAISGSSNVFEYGIIAYANRIKEEKLGVSAESLMRFGAVSREVALQMSKGAAISGKADIGISTTGIAGPTGGTPKSLSAQFIFRFIITMKAMLKGLI